MFLVITGVIRICLSPADDRFFNITRKILKLLLYFFSYEFSIFQWKDKGNINLDKTEGFITGNMNIDLLKISENKYFESFLTSEPFKPLITLPTKFST